MKPHFETRISNQQSMGYDDLKHQNSCHGSHEAPSRLPATAMMGAIVTVETQSCAPYWMLTYFFILDIHWQIRKNETKKRRICGPFQCSHYFL